MAKNRVIDSGISVMHARKWSTAQAVREIIQNYLDVLEEFKCEGTLYYNLADKHMYAHDRGPGLRVEHLAFGFNDKAEGSIGQFGEGLKSGLLVLSRENVQMEILSNKLTIRPFLKMSKNFGVDTLHYELSDVEEDANGTSIKVWCTEEQFEEAKLYFVKLDSSFQSIEEKVTGFVGDEQIHEKKISLPGGHVYVNGSKIGDIPNAVFSYHLTGSQAQAAINRDRDAIDINIINPIVKSMLGNTTSMKVAETLLRKIVVDREGDSCYEENLGLYSYNDALWMKAWSKIYDKKWVLPSSSLEENTAAGYRGYSVLNNVGYNVANFLGSFGVKYASDVLKKPAADKKELVGRVAIKDLAGEEVENINWALLMIAKYYADPRAGEWKLAIGKDLNILTGSVGDSRSIGVCERDNKTIWLSKDILHDRKETLYVMLHETVHKVSNENDLTSEFERALLEVATGIIMGEEDEAV